METPERNADLEPSKPPENNGEVKGVLEQLLIAVATLLGFPIAVIGLVLIAEWDGVVIIELILLLAIWLGVRKLPIQKMWKNVVTALLFIPALTVIAVLLWFGLLAVSGGMRDIKLGW